MWLFLFTIVKDYCSFERNSFLISVNMHSVFAKYNIIRLSYLPSFFCTFVFISPLLFIYFLSFPYFLQSKTLYFYLLFYQSKKKKNKIKPLESEKGKYCLPAPLPPLGTSVCTNEEALTKPPPSARQSTRFLLEPT